MTKNKKVTIGEELITIPAAQFARLLNAAVYSDFLRANRTVEEAKIANMRNELRVLNGKMVTLKTTSGAGASAEPQATQTNADETKADAGKLAIETEGRVSGGERAELESLRKERDELKAKLAAAERCIDDAVVAWRVEDGTIESFNRVGEILIAYRGIMRPNAKVVVL